MVPVRAFVTQAGFDGGVKVMPLDIATHVALGLDQRVSAATPGDASWPLNRTVTKYDWSYTQVYKNTIRDIAVYLPANHNPKTPLNVLICNDGMSYLARRGGVRVAAVLDSLHAQSSIAPTAAIFVNPGRAPDAAAFGTSTGYDAAARQRRIEYDTLSPAIGAFLADSLATQGISSSARKVPYAGLKVSYSIRLCLAAAS